MCPSSWKLYLDDFPFFGSSLAHEEPELELFEVWEIMVMICLGPRDCPKANRKNERLREVRCGYSTYGSEKGG